MTAVDELLESRYGRRRPSPKRTRLWLTMTAVVALLGFGAFAWASIASTSADAVDSTVVGFEPGDRMLQLTIEVTTASDRNVVCELEALGSSKQIVGWREVTLPPIEGTAQRLTIPIRTVEPAVTGLISKCSLA